MSTQLGQGMRRLGFNFWVVIRPAEDVDGQWVAHCLDLDVITQGNSISHVFQMAAEAVVMAVVDSLELGIDVLAHRAPEENWEALERLQREGKFETVSLDKMEDRSDELVAIATQLSVEIRPAHVVTPMPLQARWSQSMPAMGACA